MSKIIDFEQLNGIIYRKSKFASADDAMRRKEYHSWEETYGVTASFDAITNACNIANMISDGSAQYDIKVKWRIDGKWLTECFLADSIEHIQKFLTKE